MQNLYFKNKNTVKNDGILGFQLVFLAVLSVFALLVSDTATSLASRLTRSLAFTATTVFCAFAKVTSFDCFNMFHSCFLQNYRDYICIITLSDFFVNKMV